MRLEGKVAIVTGASSRSWKNLLPWPSLRKEQELLSPIFWIPKKPGRKLRKMEVKHLPLRTDVSDEKSTNQMAKEQSSALEKLIS